MKRITLRLPDDLAEAIEKLAERRDRSLNSEIVRAIKIHVRMAEELLSGNVIADNDEDKESSGLDYSADS